MLLALYRHFIYFKALWSDLDPVLPAHLPEMLYAIAFHLKSNPLFHKIVTFAMIDF